MRIIHLIPGAGEDFYCENCLRDAALLHALRRGGHDVLMVPMYLPAGGASTAGLKQSSVFFGGVNVYLQQKWRLFRSTPRWVDRPLDNPRLLRWVGRLSGMTRAADLAEATFSMLRGQHGRQRKELERLLAYLTCGPRPDVVILSNALLLGLAPSIRETTGARLVCLLQDEDGFLDAFPEPRRSDCYRLMAELTDQVDVLIASSHYYAARMAERLGGRLAEVVYNGVEPAPFVPNESPDRPPVIGFLSQITAEKGIETLVEAVLLLAGGGRLPPIRLHLAGGLSGAWQRRWRHLCKRLTAAGGIAGVEVHRDLTAAGKAAFLRELSVLSVPTVRPEASALYLLEAWAHGVPVVQPDHGAFPELLAATGGGLLFTPGDARGLAGKLAELLTDPPGALAMGAAARDAVAQRFHVDHQARRLVELASPQRSTAT